MTNKLKEDMGAAPTNGVGGGAIAGIGVANPNLANQAEPGVKNAKNSQEAQSSKCHQNHLLWLECLNANMSDLNNILETQMLQKKSQSSQTQTGKNQSSSKMNKQEP